MQLDVLDIVRWVEAQDGEGVFDVAKKVASILIGKATTKAATKIAEKVATKLAENSEED